jgi:hypothetical protein
LKLQLKPETHRAVQTHGLRVLFRLNLPPGRYQLRAAAHEPATGAAGSVFYDVDVPDFAAARLSMSGVVLTAPRAAQTPTARMDPLFQGVLQSPPTTRRTFGAEETLTALVEVYGTTAAMRAGLDLLTTVRGADGRVRFSTVAQGGADERAAQDTAAAYAIAVPLAGLPPGPYTLRIEARPRSGNEQIAFRELPFEIGTFDR